MQKFTLFISALSFGWAFNTLIYGVDKEAFEKDYIKEKITSKKHFEEVVIDGDKKGKNSKKKKTQKLETHEDSILQPVATSSSSSKVNSSPSPLLTQSSAFPSHMTTGLPTSVVQGLNPSIDYEEDIPGCYDNYLRFAAGFWSVTEGWFDFLGHLCTVGGTFAGTIGTLGNLDEGIKSKLGIATAVLGAASVACLKLKDYAHQASLKRENDRIRLMERHALYTRSRTSQAQASLSASSAASLPLSGGPSTSSFVPTPATTSSSSHGLLDQVKAAAPDVLAKVKSYINSQQ